MKICLSDWKVAGFWPYTPLQAGSMETGHVHQGVTGAVDATVPGSVYADLLRAGLIPDPYVEQNSLLCEWVADRWWVYQTSFTPDPAWRGQRVRLVFEGIDYKAHVFFNGKKVAEHEGMYAPLVLELSDTLNYGEPNALKVVLEAAPDEMSQIGYTSRTFTQKARFTYKWDFCPRLIGMGLWGEVFLQVTGAAVLGAVSSNYADGVLTATVAADAPARVKAQLTYEGTEVAQGEAMVAEGVASFELPVEQPHLWYPNGSGEQPLYQLRFIAYIDETVSDEREVTVGLRTLEYTRCDGAIESALPYIPVINGERVYIKGVNMTPLDMMYGCVTAEQYDRFVRLCRDAGVNLIRVWGGGVIEKEAFYDACDREGIMVWQEFIQSSSGLDNVPSKRPEFLKLCRQTAEWAVPARRYHVSLTFWSGGNELMDADGFPATYEDENLAMLREITTRLDPQHLMLPTSASGPLAWMDADKPELNHDVHGPWKYAGERGHYDYYNRSPIQLHSEFGVDGMTNEAMIEKYLAPENRDRIYTMEENVTWRHHGEWWDTYGYRDYPLFGDMGGNLSDFVAVSQFMQGEGIRYALEANRRRGWRCAGSIIWQMNEPWPNVSCTNMMDYSLTPKLAYYFYREAMKPFHISLRYDRFVWEAGDTFTATPFVHDGAEEATAAAMHITATDEKGRVLGTFTGEVNFTVPEGVESITLCCEATMGEKIDKNRYIFFVRGTDRPPCSAEAVKEFLQHYPER